MRPILPAILLVNEGCRQAVSTDKAVMDTADKLAARVRRLDTTKAPPSLPLPLNPPTRVDRAKVAAESAKIQSLRIVDIAIGAGPVVREGEPVTVHYVGFLPDGYVVDTSYKGEAQPYTFMYVDKGATVIRGWIDGLKGMRVGGRRKLYIPARLAYGANPPPGPIPQNAALIFDIELLFVGGVI
jgi:hypothetical protein